MFPLVRAEKLDILEQIHDQFERMTPHLFPEKNQKLISR